MSASNDYLRYVQEQLTDLGAVTSRRMFGAFGLYSDGVFFGLISDDTLYFKVGAATRGDYESRGMGRFKPYRDRPGLSMTYYEVPADVLEDVEELVIWAKRAVAVAAQSPKPVRPARRDHKAR